MDFAFSEEQDAFREELRRFVGERWPMAQTRRALASPRGFDRETWKPMAAELGLVGLAVPEALGGQGFGLVELGIAFEELGRELAGGPLLSTAALALPALLASGDDAAQRRLVPAIAAGDAVATLVLDEGARGMAPGPAVETQRGANGWTLDGEAPRVSDALGADLLVVAARARGVPGVSLFVVAGDAPGLEVTPREALDPTRPLARVRFASTPAQLVGEPGAQARALAYAVETGRLALAAEMVGAAQACLDRAVAYAKTRVQFARPIGSFQAIKHKCAAVLLELEPARSIAYWSWWVADQSGATAADPGALAEAASLAKAAAGDAFSRAAAEHLHIHGGMGATWEHDAHLYYRRARADDAWLGDARAHRARLAALLGL